MEEEIFDILNETFKRRLIYCKPTTIKEASDKAVNEFKEFMKWKDDLHCPFNVHYNGEDSTRPKISYDRLSHNYTLEDVWQFWKKTINEYQMYIRNLDILKDGLLMKLK